MAVMDSMSAWAAAAGDRDTGLTWRDAVTDRMKAAGRYTPYEAIVVAEAARLGLPDAAPAALVQHWAEMRPWPDAAALAGLGLPLAFVTNCSAALARAAADRSPLQPEFTLSADEIGWYKPHPAAYRAACERLGTAPAETLFVAGSPYDAQGAQAAGLQAVLVRRRIDQRGTAARVEVVESLWALADWHPGGGSAGDRSGRLPPTQSAVR